ncbi:MORN repeat protein [Beggiatoa alba B18LD]|uniref:MORN repeat protein n=2 Tax=Beggiatoa alba TaxID=1022 RepID=I3CFA5_9GAMM|nr:MORN repeat protein [Beggiatoa alba B18LD]
MKLTVKICLFGGLLWLAACTQTISHSGCWVADPYLNGRYTGECKDGKAHGVGTAIGKDTYKGQFVAGQLQGSGLYTWSDGDRYCGSFQNGKINGVGVMLYINGSRKEGMWKDGSLAQSYAENTVTCNIR